MKVRCVSGAEYGNLIKGKIYDVAKEDDTHYWFAGNSDLWTNVWLKDRFEIVKDEEMQGKFLKGQCLRYIGSDKWGHPKPGTMVIFDSYKEDSSHPNEFIFINGKSNVYYCACDFENYEEPPISWKPDEEKLIPMLNIAIQSMPGKLFFWTLLIDGKLWASGHAHALEAAFGQANYHADIYIQNN